MLCLWKHRGEAEIELQPTRNPALDCQHHAAAGFAPEKFRYPLHKGARGGAVGWGTALQAARSRVRFPMASLDFFHWHNPSGRTMALGSTEPLKKWVPGMCPGGKGGRCVGLTILPPSCADCLEIWEPQTPGTLRECLGLLYTFTFTFLTVQKAGLAQWTTWKITALPGIDLLTVQLAPDKPCWPKQGNVGWCLLSGVWNNAMFCTHDISWVSLLSS